MRLLLLGKRAQHPHPELVSKGSIFDPWCIDWFASCTVDVIHLVNQSSVNAAKLSVFPTRIGLGEMRLFGAEAEMLSHSVKQRRKDDDSLVVSGPLLSPGAE